MRESLVKVEHPGLILGKDPRGPKGRSIEEQVSVAMRGHKSAAGLAGPYFDIAPANGAKLLVPGGQEGDKNRALMSQLETSRYPEMAAVEIRSIGPFIGDADLTPILNKYHPDWKKQLVKIGREGQEMAINDDAVYTSMSSINGEGHITTYQVNDMVVLREKAPWLISMFENEIRSLAAVWSGEPNLILGEDPSATNSNRAEDGDYGGHVDRNWFTANLAVVQADKGGLLEIWEGRKEIKDPFTGEIHYVQVGESYSVLLEPGHVYFFNGFVHPHKVTSLSGERLVIPANYHDPDHREQKSKLFNQFLGLPNPNGTNHEQTTPGGLAVGKVSDLTAIKAREFENEIVKFN